MTLQELINLAEDRDLSKSYVKADGLYVWDYKLVRTNELELIASDSSKAGFKDKVSVQELVDYLLDETYLGTPFPTLALEIKITGVEGITVAKI